MKLEIGGGSNPHGMGYVNLDRFGGPGVDVICNVAVEGLPFPDATVEAVYSSHCLEHLSEPFEVIKEIARVCKVGSPVEIRVPHENNPMAMCPGHRVVISEAQVRMWTGEFIKQQWGVQPRRLRLLRVEAIGGAGLAGALKAFPGLTPENAMRYLSGTAHEYRFHLDVIENR